jgi:hypothetical protein
METRRIRRRERQRAHRIAGLAASVGVLCVAIGMSLPHSTTASVLLFAAAAGCLAVFVMRDETRAPLHGVGRVVRLPLFRSIAVTCASFGARVSGTFQALVGRRFQPTPIVLDEDDDEAEAWWGSTTAVPPPLDLSLLQAQVVEDAEPAPPEPAIPVLEPVVAAPMPSARVSSGESRLKSGAKHLWLTTRAHVDTLTKRAKRSGREEFTAST